VRKIYIKANIQADIVVRADDGVSVQDVEDGIRLTLDTEGSDLEDATIDWIKLDVTDSK
jgi:uncharacterized protein (UPF0212 family)